MKRNASEQTEDARGQSRQRHAQQIYHQERHWRAAQDGQRASDLDAHSGNENSARHAGARTMGDGK